MLPIAIHGEAGQLGQVTELTPSTYGAETSTKEERNRNRIFYKENIEKAKEGR